VEHNIGLLVLEWNVEHNIAGVGVVNSMPI
jgi:hypothetical protein